MWTTEYLKKKKKGTFILSKLASILSWCTVRRAWAMLLELCIFDDIAVCGQLCSNLEQGKNCAHRICMIRDADAVTRLTFSQGKPTKPQWSQIYSNDSWHRHVPVALKQAQRTGCPGFIPSQQTHCIPWFSPGFEYLGVGITLLTRNFI